MFRGVLRKMITESATSIRYFLEFENDFLIMNEFLDRNLKITFDEKKLLENMSVDKKREGNKLIFVLLEKIGQAKVKADIDKSEIVKAIQSLV